MTASSSSEPTQTIEQQLRALSRKHFVNEQQYPLLQQVFDATRELLILENRAADHTWRSCVRSLARAAGSIGGSEVAEALPPMEGYGYFGLTLKVLVAVGGSLFARRCAGEIADRVVAPSSKTVDVAEKEALRLIEIIVDSQTWSQCVDTTQIVAVKAEALLKLLEDDFLPKHLRHLQATDTSECAGAATGIVVGIALPSDSPHREALGAAIGVVGARVLLAASKAGRVNSLYSVYSVCSVYSNMILKLKSKYKQQQGEREDGGQSYAREGKDDDVGRAFQSPSANGLTRRNSFNS